MGKSIRLMKLSSKLFSENNRSFKSRLNLQLFKAVKNEVK